MKDLMEKMECPPSNFHHRPLCHKQLTVPCLPLPNYHIHAPHTTCQEHCLLYCGNSSGAHLLIHHSPYLTTAFLFAAYFKSPHALKSGTFTHSVTFIHIILPSNPECLQPLRDFSIPVMSVTAVCFPALPSATLRDTGSRRRPGLSAVLTHFRFDRARR